jgi:hypothetical protein
MPKFNILINTPGCLCINHIEVSPSPEITNAVKLVQLYVNILINTPGCLCINPIDVSPSPEISNAAELVYN